MTEHVNVQKRLASALAAALGSTYDVRPYQWGPDGKETGRRYVAVYRTDIARAVPEGGAERLPDGAVSHTLAVEVMSPHDDMAKAEDDLYEGCDDVLAVIDHDAALDGYAWTSAQRIVLGEENAQLHAMRVAVWCITTETTEE